MASGEELLRALARKQAQQFNSSPFSQAVNKDLSEAAQSVAQALMTPGNALQGQYNYVEVNPDYSVNPVAQALIGDAANMAGIVTTGSMPLPRPVGSLAMGAARIVPDSPPEGFPIRPNEPFPFMHNTEGAFNYVPKGSQATALDPKGRFIIHDQGGLGKPPDARWVKGEANFSNPLVIQWEGWKERLSQAYGGATGQKLTNLLKKDGYDGIVTFDKYGPSEIVDLK